MGRLIICLVSLVISGIASATSPSIDDLYKMLLEQQNKIASLETNQAALRREVLDSKMQEAQLRDELQETRIQFASIHKPAEIELPDSNPRREATFVASAGPLYVQPIVAQHIPAEPPSIDGTNLDSDYGFDLSLDYRSDNGWDYGLDYKHFSNKNSWLSTSIFADPDNSSYHLNYDVVDFGVGTVMTNSSDNMVTKLSGGIRYAAIDEEMSLFNNDGTRSEHEHDLYGLGPRIVISPKWTPFGGNFYLSGEIGGSFLIGGVEPIATAGSAQAYGDATIFFTMLETSAGIGYELKSDFAEFDLLVGYQYEATVPLGLGRARLDLVYRGYKGAFGKLAMRY